MGILGIQWFAIATFLYVVCLSSGEKPPKEPPQSLAAGYSMSGQIPVEFFYVDDTMNGNSTHFVYSEDDILRYIDGAKRLMNKFQQYHRNLGISNESSLSDTILDEVIKALPKSQWIQYALFNFQDLVTGKRIAVYGSMEPWLEAFLIALDAELIVTIEYNYLTYHHPKIVTVSKDEFEWLYGGATDDYRNYRYQNYFDLVVSPSAFDHDGLGRYGDPLNPDGDLLAMERVKYILKPVSGVLLLTVPIGPDVTVFNLHRRYGALRLPKLLSGWQQIRRLGWSSQALEIEANWRQTYEPVLFLSKVLDEKHQNFDL